MKHHYFYILVWIVAWNTTIIAQPDPTSINHSGFFKWDDELQEILTDVLHLRLFQAAPRIQAAQKSKKFNLLPYYLEDYLDFYFAFVDGRPKAIYGKYMERKEARLAWLEQGSDQDPYTLYTQADVHLRWAMIYALYQDNMLAFKSIKKAAVLLERNEKQFPNFLLNKRALGILHTMVGAIPGKYQWGAALVGLRGNVDQGLSELQQVIQHGKQQPDFILNEEVQQLYSMLLLYMGNDDPSAWGALNTALLDPLNNPMATYILASRYIKIGKSKQGLLLLEQRKKTDEEYPFPQLELLKGNCKLYRLDKTAEEHYKIFLEKFQGINGVKEAYQRLAWLALLNKDNNQYFYYMQQVERKGAHFISTDRSAMNEMETAKTKKQPHLKLLQARLYYDGGYYDKAYSILEQCTIKELKEEEEQIEYFYRKGRIYQKMRKKNLALEAFEETLKRGTKKPYYYVCNAALQAGMVHESREEWKEAKSYYERCLKEKPDQYQATLHSRAKIRLDALNKDKKK